MNGAQADTGLLGQLTLTDVGAFVDQVHDLIVGVWVLGLTLRVHNLSFGQATALPNCILAWHDILLWLLFNIEQLYCKLETLNIQGDGDCDQCS